jgi:thiol:disulfide interchange protein DsbD
VFERILETINTWGYELGQVLQAQLDSGSALAVFVVFAAGVLTSLTPCVYPMIPVTVTYIGGASQGNRRRAVVLSLIYAGGLAVVYASLGIAAALLGRTFGAFTRTWYIYGGVGLLFLLFGAMMVGWINIPVPGFAGKVQSAGTRRGGALGALLIGVAAGFVAAPCTAPVLASLLFYVSQTRNVIWGGTLLLVFSAGLSLLLVVLGIFSGMLSSLPRAGAWMERIKLVFGIGMMLVAVYFLVQAVGMLLHPAAGAA